MTKHIQLILDEHGSEFLETVIVKQYSHLRVIYLCQNVTDVVYVIEAFLFCY